MQKNYAILSKEDRIIIMTNPKEKKLKRLKKKKGWTSLSLPEETKQKIASLLDEVYLEANR